MDAFSITCTTCKSRLKVRDPAVIGQILACPKCGGMVLVKPPEAVPESAPAEAAPAVTSVVDVRSLQDTIGDSTFSDVDDLLSDAPPKPQIAPPALISPVPVAQPEPTPIEPPSSAAAEAAAESTDEPVEPPPLDWATARPWRYWALLAGSLVAGVALAVTVVVISIHFFQEDPPAAVPANPRAQVPAVAGVNPIRPTKPPASEPGEETPAPVAEVPPTAEVAPAEEVAPPLPAPAVANSNPPVAPPPIPAASAEKPPLAQLAATDPLGKFGPLIDAAAGNPLPAAEPPAAVGPPSLAAEPTGDVEPERPVLPRPPPREIDVAARLADPLPAIDVDAVPLSDFLQVMSDLSTIPITLRPDALWFVKAAPASPVTLKTTSTTVGAVLSDALRPLGLETTIAGGGLVIDLARSSPPRSIRFPVEDLTEGDEQQNALLADWMMALVAPESWSDAADGGKIVVEKDALTISQQSHVHAELLALCEKMCVARSMTPLTAARYDAAMFRLAPRTASARQAALATPISLNYSQPTGLVKVVERLGAAAKLRILIDWQSLAAIGWTTETEATLIAENLPLAAALTKLLEPMELTYRVVNAGTLEVLSPQTIAERVELEFYKVDGLLTDASQGDVLVERIEAALAAGMLGDAGGEIRFDPAGKCILAALPQPQQLALRKLLDQWHAAAQPIPTAAVLNTMP